MIPAAFIDWLIKITSIIKKGIQKASAEPFGGVIGGGQGREVFRKHASGMFLTERRDVNINIYAEAPLPPPDSK